MSNKLIIILLIIFGVTLNLTAQTYDALWKQYQSAQGKGMPKSCINVLHEIREKAEEERQYGHLLAALFAETHQQINVSRDSLTSYIEHLEVCDSIYYEQDRTLYWLTRAALLKTVSDQYLKDSPRFKGLTAYKEVFKKSMVDDILNDEKARESFTRKDYALQYLPFIKEGTESSYFCNDLISVVAFELNDFKALADYYSSIGNRRAACIAHARFLNVKTRVRDNTKEKFEQLLLEADSLINTYSDLAECGALAIEKDMIFDNIAGSGYNKEIRKRQYDFINDAIKRWSTWKQAENLKRSLEEMTQPSYCIQNVPQLTLPTKNNNLVVREVRNIKEMMIRAIPLREKFSTDWPDQLSEKQKAKYLDFNKAITVKHSFETHAPYEQFSDTIVLGCLPAGNYFIEVKADGKNISDVDYYMCSSNLRYLTIPMGNVLSRFVVVDATTGCPVPEAVIHKVYPDGTERSVRISDKGEYLDRNENGNIKIYVTSDDENVQYESRLWKQHFNVSQENRTETIAQLFTDRSIYRPGQTVHASLLLYTMTNNEITKVAANKDINLTLYDANNRKVSETKVTTDEYGVASADFTLPKATLNGRWHISTEHTSAYISVEEYVRPTFDVEIKRPEVAYSNGDTIEVKGLAKAFSGAAVSTAKVVYKVKRMPLWWFRYSPDVDVFAVLQSQLKTEEITTESDGSFTMKVPMILPEIERRYCPLFCNIQIEATVTDIAGESHSASLSLALGNRKTFLSCDIKEQLVADKPMEFTVARRNNAGIDIEGKVSIEIDGKKAGVCNANEKSSLPADIASGKHSLMFVCENDTVKHEVIVFRKEDQRPVIETKDWWYQNTQAFAEADEEQAYIQFGTSERDVTVFYSLFVNGGMIDSGSMKLDSSLVTKTFEYKKAYGNGVSYAVAWVKNGVVFNHTGKIIRKLPSKELKMKWTTFRDHLTPGQKEEWSLRVCDIDDTPVKANLMATLYDKSLDAIKKHDWSLGDRRYINVAAPTWSATDNYNIDLYGEGNLSKYQYKALDVPSFNSKYVHRLFDGSWLGEIKVGYQKASANVIHIGGYSGNDEMLRAKEVAPTAKTFAGMAMASVHDEAESVPVNAPDAEDTNTVSVRENLNETAFFMPQLRTDDNGEATISFTLPESVTTWRFLALAHDKDMRNAVLRDEVVAQKELMIQPRMPRFVREGDKASMPASIANLSSSDLNVKVNMTILDAETEKKIVSETRNVSVKAGETSSVFFNFDSQKFGGRVLICKMTANGGKHTDGEQHYIPVISAMESVMDTRTMIIKEKGATAIDITDMLPEKADKTSLTVEYTDAPEWLMVQSLPYIAQTNSDDVISLLAAYFTNNVASALVKANPQIATAVKEWMKDDDALKSALSKNDDLRNIIASETPWLMDAESETERMNMIYRLFDDNTLAYRNDYIFRRMAALQNADGSWSWWKGMRGSAWMTMTVMSTLARLNSMAGLERSAKTLMTHSLGYMDDVIAKEIKRMKQGKNSGKPSLSSLQLEYLYCLALYHNNMSSLAKDNVAYLLKLAKASTVNSDIMTKAMMAVVFAKNNMMTDAAEYVESIRQHTVYREDLGRYFDSWRASYSWYDYKIPTHTAAIEALKAVAPDDTKTINEMQRWLLQSKRTQSWDTPINAINAIYAFMCGGNAQPLRQGVTSKIMLDKRELVAEKSGAALGYRRATEKIKSGSHSITIDKQSEGESWANVFVQYTIPASDVKDASTGISIKREISKEQLTVGDRVKVTLTITADRDYDFVSVTDHRPACLEPTSQVSGYRFGYYQVMKDSETQYHFDQLSKGKHVVSTEYYVAREGVYSSGTATVQCAYAPEFSGRVGGKIHNVKK